MIKKMPAIDIKMVCDYFTQGKSTTEIGIICGCSRQNIHQILKRSGKNREDGGVFRRKSNKKTKSNITRGRAINPAFGITHKRWRYFRAMDSDYHKTPLIKYTTQKKQAKERGIDWDFNMDEWWGVWKKSGKWLKRGCCLGEYVMARYGDQGSYSVENCYITTASDNHLSYHYSEWPKKVLE